MNIGTDILTLRKFVNVRREFRTTIELPFLFYYCSLISSDVILTTHKQIMLIFQSIFIIFEKNIY